MKTNRVMLLGVLLACGMAHAQTPASGPAPAAPKAAPTAAASPAKKALVARVLVLQQTGIEGMARAIVEQPAGAMLQQAGVVLQQRVPPEKREAAAREIQAQAQKYAADTVPPLRDQAVKLAPSTIGPILEERFTEDELKQLVAWLESPVNRKYQQAAPEMDRALRERLIADGRSTVEPKLRELEAAVRRTLESAAQPASAPAK